MTYFLDKFQVQVHIIKKLIAKMCLILNIVFLNKIELKITFHHPLKFQDHSNIIPNDYRSNYLNLPFLNQKNWFKNYQIKIFRDQDNIKWRNLLDIKVENNHCIQDQIQNKYNFDHYLVQETINQLLILLKKILIKEISSLI